jgi:sugar phosphate isomerase/epimerase
MAEVSCGRACDVSLAVVCFGDSIRDGNMSLEEFLDTAVDLGLGAVELCDRTIKDPGYTAMSLRQRGLAMPSVALRNDFTVPAERLSEEIRHIRTWLPVVRSLGARVARVWTGWQRVDQVAKQQIIGAFDELVDVAISEDVLLAVETHGGLSNDPEFMAHLHARYPSGQVGVCLDFGNLPERRTLIPRFVPLTVHAHVKSYEFDAQGNETTVPVSWAVAQLCRAGFTGQWVLEYEGPPPYIQGIGHTLKALRTGQAAVATSKTGSAV